MFSELLKATVGLIVETPIAVATDIITMGGAITEKNEPYTVTTLKKVVDNIEKSTDWTSIKGKE